MSLQRAASPRQKGRSRPQLLAHCCIAPLRMVLSQQPASSEAFRPASARSGVQSGQARLRTMPSRLSRSVGGVADVTLSGVRHLAMLSVTFSFSFRTSRVDTPSLGRFSFGGADLPASAKGERSNGRRLIQGRKDTLFSHGRPSCCSTTNATSGKAQRDFCLAPLELSPARSAKLRALSSSC